jgi:cytochrome P450/NADPH-cytochrome P450 reductase
MLKNPSTYFAAQAEIDRVIGKEKVTVKHLSELKYINGVLRETLRLTPTAPAFARAVRPQNKDETVVGGKYEVPDQGILCLIRKIQSDPKVFGPDAAEFKPERMMDGNFEKLPKNSWKVSMFFAYEAQADSYLAIRNWSTSLHRATLCLAGSTLGLRVDSPKL